MKVEERSSSGVSSRYIVRMKAMPNLDFLRSIAVLLVALEHTLLAFHIRWVGNWDLQWLGVVGVFMFFVHTSLVLMWSLERRPQVLGFYIRRFFRIYPLSITAILVTVIFHIPTMHNPEGDTFFIAPNFKNVLSNLLLVQNIVWPGHILGVMWTLPLEVDMYLLLPFLFYLVRGKRSLWPILLLCGLLVLFDSRYTPPFSSAFLVCIPYFLSGVISFLLYSKVRPRLPAFLMLPTILALLCWFMFRASWRNGWWLAIALGLMLPFFRPFRAKWLVDPSHHIAKYSYGIYLAHPFFIALGVNMLHGYNLVVRIAAIVLPMALVVVLAYHLLEKPMIDLGARLATGGELQDEKPVPAE